MKIMPINTQPQQNQKQKSFGMKINKTTQDLLIEKASELSKESKAIIKSLVQDISTDHITLNIASTPKTRMREATYLAGIQDADLPLANPECNYSWFKIAEQERGENEGLNKIIGKISEFTKTKLSEFIDTTIRPSHETNSAKKSKAEALLKRANELMEKPELEEKFSEYAIRTLRYDINMKNEREIDFNPENIRVLLEESAPTTRFDGSIFVNGHTLYLKSTEYEKANTVTLENVLDLPAEELKKSIKQAEELLKQQHQQALEKEAAQDELRNIFAQN